MPAYIQETGRSFPNPTKGGGFNQVFKRPSSGEYTTHGDYPDVGSGMDYSITFEGAGPGTMPMGKDIVHYIGDDDPTNVTSGGGERRGVYRWYRGVKDDHMYTQDPQQKKSDFGCENESWRTAAGGYNSEPRQGTPVFYVMREQVPNSVPLNTYYSHWPDDSQLTVGGNVPTGLNGVGCGRNKYFNTGKLGYAFTSEADALAYCSGGETPVPLYEYLHPDPDHFYTIDPANEVNLSGGPIAPKHAYGGEYSYLGILCWVFAEPPRDAPTDTIVDVGRIGPTGQTLNKSGWYDYTDDDQFSYGESGWGSGGWSEFMYRQMRDSNSNAVEGPPAVNGWGNPDNVDMLSNDAQFEWAYGLSGAVKGAVPRFLGFEDMYDAQFVFYLFDTSFPWNGPIFSTQYILSNAKCCPNTTDPEGCPQCAPVWTYHSHFYEIQSDSWETTKTEISIHDESSTGVKESFWTIGTDSTTLFFRYVTRTGDFNRGDKINGWDIDAVYYFGDELKCGIMELTWDQGSGATKNTFSYQQSFTSTDNGEIEVLAGYGVPNKAAFCGTYEFPKKISYWKVEVDPQALIPHRKMDEAEMRAVVGDDGTIVAIDIVNGGRGYVLEDTTIELTHPREMDNFSATDTADFMENSINSDTDYDKALGNSRTEKGFKRKNMESAVKAYGTHSGIVDLSKDKNNELYKLKKAVVEVEKIDEAGTIKRVRVVDGGAGYNQANVPTVMIVQPEKIKVSEDASQDEIAATEKGMQEAWNHEFTDGDVQPISSTFDKETMGIIGSSMGVSPQGENSGSSVYVEVPDSYVRAASDGVDDDVTKLCMNIPAECINVDARGYISDAMPDETQFEIISGADPNGIGLFEKEVMPYAYSGTAQVDQYSENVSHLYGPFGKQRCIEVRQPKLYNITRWFDMPCAYLDANEAGEQKAFGYLPFKYCGSEQKDATFRVSLSCEGRITGSQGGACMDFIQSLPTPYLQQKRPTPTNNRTWNCRRGNVPGRCYRDPSDPNDIVFVPVGLDENTYDYNRSNFTELEQLQMWAGQNITSAAAVQTWLGHPTAQDPAGTPHSVDYTELTVASCSGGVPPNECWDTYVRGVTASDGPLVVYSEYDANGNGGGGSTFCQTSELYDSCVALDKCMDASIAINPKRMTGSGTNARMLMGPYNGTMTVRNYLTGGTIALDKSIKNYGNPYFDECSEENAWTEGTQVNEDL